MGTFQELGILRKQLEEAEQRRESVIQESLAIIRLSKLVINSLQRDERPDAYVKELQKRVKQISADFHDTEIQHTAFQEFAEAMSFFSLVIKNELPTSKELQVDPDAYLLGLCDLTGELLRFGVNGVARGTPGRLHWAKDLVADLYSEFLKFSLRNGELRRKVDSIKYNLKKLEEVAAELHLRAQKSL